MTESLREAHLNEEDWSSESAGRSGNVSRSEVDEKLAEGRLYLYLKSLRMSEPGLESPRKRKT